MLVFLGAKRNDPTHQHTLVSPGTTPAPKCLQRDRPCRSSHGGQRAGRRGGYSPCPAKMHGMHSACQLTDKGDVNTSTVCLQTPTRQSACLLCRGGSTLSMGSMQVSRLHPALPLPRACLLPSSSTVSAQHFQGSVCSRAFLPDTKLCFGFNKPQWS